MKSVAQCLPITSVLHLHNNDTFLSGAGSTVRLHIDGVVVDQMQIFQYQRICGMSLIDGTYLVLVHAENCLSVIQILSTDSKIKLIFRKSLKDYIKCAYCFSQSDQDTMMVAVVYAKNFAQLFRLSVQEDSDDSNMSLESTKHCEKWSMIYAAQVISQNGQLYVLAGTMAGELIIWRFSVNALPDDSSVSEILFTQRVHNGALFGIDSNITDNILQIATCSDDRTVSVFSMDLNTFIASQVIKLQGHSGRVWDVKLIELDNMDDADSHVLSASEDGSCRLWNMQSGQSIYKFATGGILGNLRCIDYHPHARQFIAGSNNGGVMVQHVDNQDNQIRNYPIVFDGLTFVKIQHFTEDGLIAISKCGCLCIVRNISEDASKYSILHKDVDLFNAKAKLSITSLCSTVYAIACVNQVGRLEVFTLKGDDDKVQRVYSTRAPQQSVIQDIVIKYLDQHLHVFLMTQKFSSNTDRGLNGDVLWLQLLMDNSNNLLQLQAEAVLQYPPSLAQKSRQLKIPLSIKCIDIVKCGQMYVVVGGEIGGHLLVYLLDSGVNDHFGERIMISPMEQYKITVDCDVVTHIIIVPGYDQGRSFIVHISARDGYFGMFQLTCNELNYLDFKLISHTPMSSNQLESIHITQSQKFVMEKSGNILHLLDARSRQSVLYHSCARGSDWSCQISDSAVRICSLHHGSINFSELFISQDQLRWNDRQSVDSFSGNRITCVGVLPLLQIDIGSDRLYLLCGNDDGALDIFEYSAAENLLRKIQVIKKHTGQINEINFAADRTDGQQYMFAAGAREEFTCWRYAHEPGAEHPQFYELCSAPPLFSLQDVRIMAIDSCHGPSDDMILISAVYSNSYLVLWLFDTIQNLFIPISAKNVSNSCLLSVQLIKNDERYICLIGCNDGQLLVYECLNIDNITRSMFKSDRKVIDQRQEFRLNTIHTRVNQDQTSFDLQTVQDIEISVRVESIRVHKCGMKAFCAVRSQSEDGSLIIISGGVDGSIVVSSIDLVQLHLQVLHTKRHAHSSNIQSIAVLNHAEQVVKFASIASDNVMSLWKWQQNDNVLSLVASHVCQNNDIASFAFGSTQLCAVVGNGIEVIDMVDQ
ncbi:hypothetical protein MIR68_005882 [Amoeboaphelidium protococcarum]|nr:hypothetical protein MIR68_005882 [Amoeboaphelidium protococcarum]